MSKASFLAIGSSQRKLCKSFQRWCLDGVTFIVAFTRVTKVQGRPHYFIVTWKYRDVASTGGMGIEMLSQLLRHG